LVPGVVLTLEEVAPYQGPFIVRRDDCAETQAIGREIAARIFVTVLDE
ncbi:MAG: ferrous iron transport protein A, partial [Caldilineae bacterium]